MIEGVEGSRLGIPRVELYFSRAPANLAPILDCAREHLCDIIEVERLYRILRRDENGDAVQGKDVGVKLGPAIGDGFDFFRLDRPRHHADLGFALLQVHRRRIAAMRLQVDEACSLAVAGVKLVLDLLGIVADDLFERIAFLVRKALDGIRHQLGADGIRAVDANNARGRLGAGSARAFELRGVDGHYAELVRLDDVGARIGRDKLADHGEASVAQDQRHLVRTGRGCTSKGGGNCRAGKKLQDRP